MTDIEDKVYKKLHGIQLVSVEVVELGIKVNQENIEDQEDKVEMHIKTGISKYDSKEKTIQVGLIFEFGIDEIKKAPCSIKVELFGVFHIDEEKFDLKYLEDWSKRNAPTILYPFLREQVYALSLRSGIRPVLIPLVQVPSLIRKDTESNQNS